MRGDYTLEPLAYGVHNRGFGLVKLVEAPLVKYVENIYIPQGRFD